MARVRVRIIAFCVTIQMSSPKISHGVAPPRETQGDSVCLFLICPSTVKGTWEILAPYSTTHVSVAHCCPIVIKYVSATEPGSAPTRTRNTALRARFVIHTSRLPVSRHSDLQDTVWLAAILIFNCKSDKHSHFELQVEAGLLVFKMRQSYFSPNMRVATVDPLADIV